MHTITKPFSCLPHCKVSCDSPCCVKLCGDDDNHCSCNIDTHETIGSDEEEQIEKQHILKQVLIILFANNIHRGPRRMQGALGQMQHPLGKV